MKYLGWLVLLILFACGIGYYWYERAPVAAIEVVPTVTVKVIEPEKVRIWSEFSGRLQAVDIAEIRPQVSGRITEVRFEDGAFVNAGDVLFVIDPRPYVAAVERAEARLVTANANAEYAKLEVDRAANMVKTEAVAKRIYDERNNANEAAVAAIKSAKADLLQAEVDLEHAYVQAPISGRVGRVELTVGNLVQPGVNAPLMTRVVANNPIYVDFEVDEQTYLDSVRSVAHNRKLEREIPVQLYILGNKKDAYQGSIYSFDNRLDVATGTIRARAKFDNEDGILVPGMFVTVALGNQKKEALLIPQVAINSDQSKKYVYVLDKDNKATFREIILGPEYGNNRIVVKGLGAGDRVVVNGMQHIKSGQKVNPVEAKGS